jgi:hypothetical protein
MSGSRTRILLSVLALAFAGSAWAQRGEWLELRNPSFTVISQLDEDDTEEWAEEFHEFVRSLGVVLPLDGNLPPPLTAVLFQSARDFAPYRMRTESGVSHSVVGLFANSASWSVMGLPYRGRYSRSQRIAYHEGVHWFASGDQYPYPLWLEEGLAEVFSTFEVRRDIVRWGQSIPEHVSFLQARDPQPLEAFLQSSQDEALHSRDSYYPQAWALLHFLLFGNPDTGRQSLDRLLAELRTSDFRSAFETAFGEDLETVEAQLRDYTRRGTYPMAEFPRTATVTPMDTRPATVAGVQLALARLALGGNNADLAVEHVENLLQIAENEATTYDMLATLEAHRGNDGASVDALRRAVSLGSEDALTYRLLGWADYENNARRGSWPDEALDPGVARRLADYFLKSIDLQPRQRESFRGFVFAILCLDELNDRDVSVLELGSQLYPDDGILQLGLAKATRSRGDSEGAIRLLTQRQDRMFYVTVEDARIVRSLRDRWWTEQVAARVDDYVRREAYAEGIADLDALLEHNALTASQRQFFDDMRNRLIGRERFFAAAAALEEDRLDDAIRILEALVNDPESERTARQNAERLLEQIRSD